MSLQCPNNPAYHTSAQQKLQSRNAAKIYRYGSPKIRDLLREKCRVRVREARQCSFEKSRKLEEFGINDILRQELAELEKDITLQEEIFKELVDELNEWVAQQMELEAQQEEAYMINVGESDALLCPVCQKNELKRVAIGVDKPFYKCQCETCFFFAGDEALLASTLRSKIDLHEQKCCNSLSFFVEPQLIKVHGNVLNAICEKCDYFCNF